MIRLSEILDDVRYGNSTKDQIEKIRTDKGGVLKRAIQLGIVKDVLENHPFPANSSDETRNELEYLTEIVDDVAPFISLSPAIKALVAFRYSPSW